MLRARAKLLRVLPQAAITRLGPRFDRAVVEGFAAIGDDEIQIEVDGVAESLAARAGAVGIVEGEEARLGLLVDGAAVFAFEALVEDKALGRGAGARVGGEIPGWLRRSLRDSRSRWNRPGASGFGRDGQAIHENADGLREIDVEQSFRGREFVHAAILIEAVEAALLQVGEGLLHGVLRGAAACLRGARGVFSAGSGKREAEEHVEAAAGRERQNARGDFVDGVAANFARRT